MTFALGDFILLTVTDGRSEEELGGSIGLIVSVGKKYYLESIGDEVSWPACVTLGSEVMLLDADNIVRVTGNLYGTPASNVMCIL